MKKEIVFGLLIALFVVIALAPLASSSPDGLQKVAADKGFLHKAFGKELIKSPLSGYMLPGIHNKRLSGILAGTFGMLGTFGLMYGIAKFNSRKKKDETVSKE